MPLSLLVSQAAAPTNPTIPAPRKAIMAVAEEIELNQPPPAPAPARTPVESVQAFAKTPMGKNFLRGLGVAALIAIGVALYMWNQPPEY